MLAYTGIARAELTANVGVTTNYVFRGETQTNDDPAIQGGIDFVHERGLYLGAWASNVDFPAVNGEGFEMDAYLGYKFDLGNEMAIDVGYITYQYTDNVLPDASEVYIGFSVRDLSITYFNGDVENSANDYSYIDVKYKLVLPKDVKLLFHYGYKDNQSSRNVDDASIGISKEVNGFTGSLTVTTIDGTANDDDKIFLQIVKTFNL